MHNSLGTALMFCQLKRVNQESPGAPAAAASWSRGPTALLSPDIGGARLFCRAKRVSQQPRAPERERPWPWGHGPCFLFVVAKRRAPRHRGDGCQRGPGGESGLDAPSPRRRGAPLRPLVPLVPKAAVWLEQPQVCRSPAGRGPGTPAGMGGARLCFFSSPPPPLAPQFWIFAKPGIRPPPPGLLIIRACPWPASRCTWLALNPGVV